MLNDAYKLRKGARIFYWIGQCRLQSFGGVIRMKTDEYIKERRKSEDIEIANKDISMKEFCYKMEDKSEAAARAGCGG